MQRPRTDEDGVSLTVIDVNLREQRRPRLCEQHARNQTQSGALRRNQAHSDALPTPSRRPPKQSASCLEELPR